jgi:hypothetical protein
MSGLQENPAFQRVFENARDLRATRAKHWRAAGVRRHALSWTPSLNFLQEKYFHR